LDLPADLGGNFLRGVWRVVFYDNFEVNVGTHIGGSVFILRYDGNTSSDHLQDLSDKASSQVLPRR
jgi:hypothetical protein